jgi:thiol-disulfide isomerase/thioredoxin
MRTNWVIPTSLFLSLTTAASGQTPAGSPAPANNATAPTVDAKTPRDCVDGLNQWRQAQLTPVMAGLRTVPAEKRDSAIAVYQAAYTRVNAEAIRSAKQCAAKFSVETTPSSQLVELASLYSFTGDSINRRRASERALAATDLSPRQRGQALLAGMNEEIASARDYFGINAGAEQVVRKIDALPDSLADIKLSAHQTMVGRYEYLDVNEGLRVHASALIALGRKLGNQNAMMSGFESLARSAADRLQPDSAVGILDAAEKEISQEKTAPRFADFRNRYALIGTKAATVSGTWWLNSSPSASSIEPADGKVHLVEFTAHWCVPCKNSYPGLRALAERFKGQAFEGVMVTELYGYIGQRRPLTAEQEVDADREYYTHEHALPFRVAINARASGQQQPVVDAAYRVGGIPQIVIIDRGGIIRQIVTGWDQGNSARIGDLIERLLKQPAASDR